MKKAVDEISCSEVRDEMFSDPGLPRCAGCGKRGDWDVSDEACENWYCSMTCGEPEPSAPSIDVKSVFDGIFGQPVPLMDYWRQLDQHDWFWHFADDRQAYAKGQQEEARLRGIATHSAEHERLFNSFSEYAQNYRRMPEDRVSKPVKPLEVA